jgi:alanine racemase
MGLVSRVVAIRTLQPGERVGYGGTFRARHAHTLIGVVPAGYYDCVPRSLSNLGAVLVDGVRCDIVGRVSMDSMTVDITDAPSPSVGSNVLIYGRWDDWLVPMEEVAAAVGAIPYELMTGVGPRVERIFTRH